MSVCSSETRPRLLLSENVAPTNLEMTNAKESNVQLDSLMGTFSPLQEFRKQQVGGSNPLVGSAAFLIPLLHSKGSVSVRVLVPIKAAANSEACVMPSTKLLEAMGRYN